MLKLVLSTFYRQESQITASMEARQPGQSEQTYPGLFPWREKSTAFRGVCGTRARRKGEKEGESYQQIDEFLEVEGKGE
jgi:hypothetical protein